MCISQHCFERMPSALPSVDTLTDDEPAEPNPGLSRGLQLVPQEGPKRRPAKRKLQVAFKAEVNVKDLRHHVQSSCGCQCGCFKAFRCALFDDLVNLRKTLCQLEKPDQDNFVNTSEIGLSISHKAPMQFMGKNQSIVTISKVFQLMRGHDESTRGCRHLTLLRQKICNRGFCKLLGIGRSRFRTLMGSLKNGQQFAPLDGRYMPREAPKQSAKREAIYDFLYELWMQAGETLPDRDHTSSNKRPRQGGLKFDDPQMDRSLIRHIPPGKIADYWRLCKLQHPEMTISKKIFSSVGGPNS